MNKEILADITQKELLEAEKYKDDLIYGRIDKEDIENAEFLSQIQKDWLIKALDQFKRNSYTWGLDKTDSRITTFKRGEASILVADENQGKTTFLYFVARQNRKKYNHKVVYYSLEVTKDEMVDSIARQHAGITKLQYRDGEYYNNPEYLKKKKELEEQDDVDFIGRKASEVTTIEQIEERVRGLEDVDLLVIDNLSCLMSSNSDTNADFQDKAIRIIGLAKDLNIPIVLVHHYRKSDGRAKGGLFRPLHDMKGGGILKDLFPKVYQVTRNPDDTDPTVGDEFYLREGKLRGGDKKEQVMMFHNKGDFIDAPDQLGF